MYFLISITFLSILALLGKCILKITKKDQNESTFIDDGNQIFEMSRPMTLMTPSAEKYIQSVLSRKT